jgi:hypothetical protein
MQDESILAGEWGRFTMSDVRNEGVKAVLAGEFELLKLACMCVPSPLRKLLERYSEDNVMVSALVYVCVCVYVYVCMCMCIYMQIVLLGSGVFAGMPAVSELKFYLSLFHLAMGDSQHMLVQLFVVEVLE